VWEKNEWVYAFRQRYPDDQTGPGGNRVRDGMMAMYVFLSVCMKYNPALRHHFVCIIIIERFIYVYFVGGE